MRMGASKLGGRRGDGSMVGASLGCSWSRLRSVLVFCGEFRGQLRSQVTLLQPKASRRECCVRYGACGGLHARPMITARRFGMPVTL